MELREKIADLIDYHPHLPEYWGVQDSVRNQNLAIADRILALPEIKEALEMRGLVRDHGLEITDKHVLGKPHEGVRVGHSISTGTKE